MTEPQLLPTHAHRALLYVERLDLVGVRPTGHQVEDFAQTDGPMAAVYSSPALRGIGTAIALMQMGGAGKKIRDAERVVGYLARMGWITTEGEGLEGRVELTDLGRALLVGLRKEAPGQLHSSDHETAIVLDPSSPIAHLELTGVVADAGAGMFVDPFFKADTLHWLITATSITRVLTSALNGEVPRLELALHGLAAVPGADRLEIRATRSEALHDRCVIAANGSIRLLGTSLTGIGKHLTTITPLPPAATKPFAKHLHAMWDKGERVEPKAIRRAEGLAAEASGT